MDIERVREFVRNHHRGVLVTRRGDGSPQTSPVLAAVDEDGALMISSRETAYKVKNLRRDPRVTYCAFTDKFFGTWYQVDGRAEVVSLPAAMDLLVAYYRSTVGEHEDWDDYRAAMERDQRVIIRIEAERAGPDRSG